MARLGWKGPVEGYTVNVVHSNVWRFTGMYMDKEDLVSEGKVLFYRLKRKNPKAQSPELMALYKVSFANLLHTLSCKAYVQRNLFSDEELTLNTGQLVELNEGTLLCMLSSAPEEVREVIEVVLEAPSEVLKLVFSNRVGVSAGWNMVLRDILGRQADFVGMVTRYFGGQ